MESAHAYDLWDLGSIPRSPKRCYYFSSQVPMQHSRKSLPYISSNQRAKCPKSTIQRPKGDEHHVLRSKPAWIIQKVKTGLCSSWAWKFLTNPLLAHHPPCWPGYSFTLFIFIAFSLLSLKLINQYFP